MLFKNQSAASINFFKSKSDNSDNAKIKKIRKIFNKLRGRFSKSEIKTIRRRLYRLGKNKNLSKSKTEKIKKYLAKVEKNLDRLKKYCDYDDHNYRGIRDIENWFDEIDDDDYYKPIKINGVFNDNHIEYESRGDKKDKDKNLSVKEYLDKITPYLYEMIDN